VAVPSYSGAQVAETAGSPFRDWTVIDAHTVNSYLHAVDENAIEEYIRTAVIKCNRNRKRYCNYSKFGGDGA
jgi:hypothetical protein